MIIKWGRQIKGNLLAVVWDLFFFRQAVQLVSGMYGDFLQLLEKMWCCFCLLQVTLTCFKK